MRWSRRCSCIGRSHSVGRDPNSNNCPGPAQRLPQFDSGNQINLPRGRTPGLLQRIRAVPLADHPTGRPQFPLLQLLLQSAAASHETGATRVSDEC